MSLFDHAYYCGQQTEEDNYNERLAWEQELEATTPEPTPNVFAENVWASGQPVE